MDTIREQHEKFKVIISKKPLFIGGFLSSILPRYLKAWNG